MCFMVLRKNPVVLLYLFRKFDCRYLGWAWEFMVGFLVCASTIQF